MNTDAMNPTARRARLDAIDALGWAPRIDTALRQLAHAESPLRASSGQGGTSGGISDPTGTRVIGSDHNDNDNGTLEAPDPAIIRRQLLEALWRRENDARTISVILNQWAPHITADARKQLDTIDSMWCDNHRNHGQFVTCKPGTRHCGWCADVNRAYGTPTKPAYPTAGLIRLHDAGRRISEAQYEAALGKKKTKKGKGKAA